MPHNRLADASGARPRLQVCHAVVCPRTVLAALKGCAPVGMCCAGLTMPSSDRVHLGSLLLLQSLARSRLPLFALDLVCMRSAILTRSLAHLRSTVLASDHAIMDMLLSLQTFARPSALSSAFRSVQLGPLLAVVEVLHVGSALVSRQLAQIAFSILVLGAAKVDPISPAVGIGHVDFLTFPRCFA